MPDGADALLFDLGGVVIDIDFNRAFARWPSIQVVIKLSSGSGSRTTMPTDVMKEERSTQKNILPAFDRLLG